MNSIFSIKKRGGWLWSTGHTRQQVERKAVKGTIDGGWLVCPHGEAERAISVAEFLAQPAALGCLPPTAFDPSGAQPPVHASFPILAVITAVLCFVISAVNAGWGFVILIWKLWGLPFILLFGVHIFLHKRASTRPRRPIGLGLASNATLLLTFLLLPDGGDGRGWIAYKVVLFGASKGSIEAEAPVWLPAWVVPVAFLAYIGTTSWLLLTRRRTK
jgi:hypothetical protein